MSFIPFLPLFIEFKKDDRRIIEERKKLTISRLPLDEEGVLSWLDEVSLVDGVFDGAFGGVGHEEVVVGEGVVRLSSSFVRSTKSCFGGMM
ncbi:hypothetical protein Tco_1478257, partial [Tanacetum coccineum]